MAKYDHQAIEKKWQKRWLDEKQGVASGTNGEKSYVLVEFPYPSGDGLHVGHVRSYTALDAVARKRRMEGKNVLFPLGWDAFGLPTENYALKTGVHPRVATDTNIANFRRQMQALGLSFDWSREVDTTDPKYYKWTQWIFLRLLKAGLAYQATIPISWCPKDKIGLANEEVIAGKCERCGTTVERRLQKQWMLKITAYADRLLKDLDTVDYAERIKAQQVNWIGRSEGAEVKFEIEMPKQVRHDKKKPVALIIHGSPIKPDYQLQMARHFFPWLRRELQALGYEVIAPDLPKANAPEYETWKQAVTTALGKNKLNHSSLVIGVSAGGSFVARYLAEQKLSVANIIFIAPGCIARTDDTERDNALRKFYDFEFVPNIAREMYVVYSTDDQERRISGAKKFIQELNAQPIILTGRGHFTQHDGVTDIPELLPLMDKRQSVQVFTTRPDTLFGATYLVLSPEHPLVDSITTSKQKNAIEKYKKRVASKSDLERVSLDKEKTGVFTGAYAMNPANNEKIPVWIADYVLTSYGTGAIMAVPAHDERDNAFAKKFKLPIINVITPPSVMSSNAYQTAVGAAVGYLPSDVESECWTGEGTMIHSGKFDGMTSEEGRKKIVAMLEKEGKAKFAVNYKLRDWVFSRQHYWGEPIPVVHCDKCGVVPVSEDQLPVELPQVEKYQPTGTGESPLAAITDWVNVKCPTCGGPAKRETDTMPNWAGSSWYSLRYCDPHNEKEFADMKKLQYWMPVDLYNGGMEHTTLHLLYSRFWHKFLFDQELVPTAEPYQKRVSHGIVLASDGRKMSKSFGNVVNPDELVERYGADSVRLYEMFMGPFEDMIPWDTKGIVGMRRFLDRVNQASERVKDVPMKDAQLLNSMVKVITQNLEAMKFNTCVSHLMEWSNHFAQSSAPEISQEEFETFLKVLSPFAPHLVEELWSQLGHSTLVSSGKWPKFDEKMAQAADAKIAVQVNGKLRGTLLVPSGSEQEIVASKAMELENVKKFVPGIPKKTIFVKDRLINFVA